MSSAVAPDDVVRTFAEAEDNTREPLLVVEPLIEFLDAAGLGSGELTVAPVGDGHSNVTYVVSREGAEVVLRRPPRGPLPPSAHDVLREARLLRALEPFPVRTPRVLAVGDDTSIIGAPFYVMEKVEGEVVAAEIPERFDNPSERRRMSEELVDSLVELHSVDWREAGLEGFGKPSGYLERQLRRFTGLWEHNQTREIDAVEQVGEWLRTHMPEQQEATIVHGDYRLGNTMLAPDPPARLVAIFDWEMATIGDPLADLGYMLMFWVEAADPPRGMFELHAITRREGFLSRGEMIARYEAQSGRSMGDLRWYTALAIWKSVVFMEGNYKRAISGSTDDPYLKSFGEGVIQLAERALETIRDG